jgi:hypothetical protein
MSQAHLDMILIELELTVITRCQSHAVVGDNFDHGGTDIEVPRGLLFWVLPYWQESVALWTESHDS